MLPRPLSPHTGAVTDLRLPLPGGGLLALRVALLCLDGGRLLTCWDHRYPDFLALPGGAVQAGESSEAAAHREWHEETGLSAGEVQLAGFVENFFDWEGAPAHELGFYYRVSPSTLPVAPCPVRDNPDVELRWLPLAELGEHTVYPLCLPELLRVPPGKVRHFVVDERSRA